MALYVYIITIRILQSVYIYIITKARGPGETDKMIKIITFAIEDCLPSVCQPVVPLALAHASKAAGVGDFLQEMEILVFVKELGQTVNLSHRILRQRVCSDRQFVSASDSLISDLIKSANG